MPTVEILKSDDITPATAIAIAASAGSESAQTELHVWYSKGTAGGTAKNLRLVIAAESKTAPGTLVYSGVPCLDRGWLKVRVSGTVNPGSVAGLSPQSTGWYPVSSGLPLTLADLPGNCARKVFVKLATPIDVGQVTEGWNLYLVPTWEDVVTPMPLGLRAIGCGILSGVGDLFVTEPVSPATIVPSDPADSYVHVSDVSCVVAGVEAVIASADVQLDQHDIASNLLTAGQSYIAALEARWLGYWGVSVTKGARATTGSALPPALPAGCLLAYVEIAYGAGGSVIESGAITNLTAATRFKVVAGTGRTVTIGPGRALLPGVFIERRDTTTLTLTASPRWVWLATDGTFSVTDSTTPAYAGALLLAKVTSTSGAITSIEDLRSVVRSPFNSTPFTLPGNVAIVDDVDFGGHAIVNAAGVLTTADGIDIALGGHTVSGGLLQGMTLADGLDADEKTITDPVLSGAVLGSALDAASWPITALPTATDDEVGYAASVAVVHKHSFKPPCRVAALVDVPVMEGELEIDGIQMYDGDRVLLTTQGDGRQNGPWVVRTGAWAKPADCALAENCTRGAMVYVVEGTAANNVFVQTAIINDPGVESQVWAPLTTGGGGAVNGVPIDLGGNAISNGSADTLSLGNCSLSNGLNANGHEIYGGSLRDMSLGSELNANGQKITAVPTLGIVEDHGNAANMQFVLARPAKTWARLCSTAHVGWPNLALNGQFDADLSDWTAGAGWAWDGMGAALHTAGNTESLSQTFDLVEGVRYRTSYAISGTVGTVQIYLGAVAGIARAFDYGACEEYLVAAATETVAVQFVPSSDFDGTIDAVHIEATFFGTPGDPDIDGTTILDTDRVLLTAQDDGTQNGKWIASLTDKWTRHPDCASAYYLPAGSFLYVKAGSANGHKVFMQTADVADFATDPQTWELWATIGGA